MTKRFTYTFAAIFLAAVSLHAQPRITAEIPFPFHVGDSVLPAGSYTTDMRVQSGLVVGLRSADGKHAAMVLSNGLYSPSGPTQPKFVFNQYGNQYFLSEVWTGSGEPGRQILKTKREVEVAASVKRNVQAIVAKR